MDILVWITHLTWFKSMSYAFDWMTGGRFCGCSQGAHLLGLATLLSTLLITAGGVYAWYAFIKPKPVKIEKAVEL